jgi:hypothetical protein
MTLKINWVKILFLILVCIVIYNQVRIIKIIYENQDKLDQDPFVYGAIRYNIKEATCFITEYRTLYFNQSVSKFIIKNKPFFG